MSIVIMVLIVLLGSFPSLVHPDSEPSVLFTYDPQLSDNVTTTESVFPYVLPVRDRPVIELERVMRQIFPAIVFSSEPIGRSLVFNATPTQFKSIKAVLAALQSQQKVVQFNIEIIEMSRHDLEQYDAVFSKLGASFRVSYDPASKSVSPLNDIQAQLIMMIENGQASLLAQPRLMTLDNHQATIHVGDRVPYVTQVSSLSTDRLDVQYIDSGIYLEVLPQLSDSTTLSCQVLARLSSVKLWKKYGDQEYPILSSRETQTRVRLKSGEPFILAGLFDQVEKQRVSSVPILGDLPLLGFLFRETVTETMESDIVFIITPKIF